jgi:hypothetical protein
MKITRRNFVQALGTTMAITMSGTAVSSALGGATAASPGTNSSSGFFAMTADEIKSFIGQRFVASSMDGRQVELTLAEVNSFGRPANLKRGYLGESFSIVFKKNGKEDLVQGVYEMKSAKLDRFSALLVPTDRHRRECEMVVNRLSR